MMVKGDFILAEMINAVQYFSKLFGDYPFPTLRGVLHPRDFGQGLPGLLFLPATDKANKRTFAFLAHETSHQWWGDVVTWRSYRDQWLSEGFAEYSGLLYTGMRDSADARQKLIREIRDRLRLAPQSETGMGQGRLATVGPLIYGHRLRTHEAYDAYDALVYGKGALVLRMLHFLLTDPHSGDGQPFFDMMSDFVNRQRNGTASTEDFMKVAGEHFAKTALAQKYGLKNLDWFFAQWVYQAELPSYRLEYALEPQPDGKCKLRGTLYQRDLPPGVKWLMPLPLVAELDGDQVSRTVIHAYGPETSLEMMLPKKPKRVELDPEMWVLSSDSSTKQR
jgi:aminopeptidase N